MGMILAANPHRVFISRLGRIEVYQPIPPPSGKSPEGPHTHVLPKLLKSGRTHPATDRFPRAGFPARISIRRIRRATAGRGPAVRRHAPPCLSAGDGGVRRSREPCDQTAGGRCGAGRRAAHGGCQRPPRPNQHPHRLAPDDAAGTCVSGADRLAGELRLCGPDEADDEPTSP